MADMVAIYQEEVTAIKDVAGIVPSAVFQLITTDMTKHFSRNGGNPLGLAGQGPLNRTHPCLPQRFVPADMHTVINIDISWSNASDDERVLTAAQNMVNRSIAAARAQGLDHPYLYQNYASYQQNVFASYGADNLAKLKSISAKYDPQQVWQKLQPGYFKLG